MTYILQQRIKEWLKVIPMSPEHQNQLIAFILTEVKYASDQTEVKVKREATNDLIGKLCVDLPDWAQSFLKYKKH